MGSNASPNLSVCDDDINNILKEYDPYIVSQAIKSVPRRSSQHLSHDLFLDVDEIAQRSRIKLWLALKRQPLRNIKSYIKCIVRTEAIDMIRQSRPRVPLISNEDGELSEESISTMASRESDNPENIFIQRERMSEQLDKLVEIVLKLLPARQRFATLCSLREKVDYIDEFERKLADYEIQLEEVSWPNEKKERRALQASGCYARQTIARHMNVDVSSYKQAALSNR